MHPLKERPKRTTDAETAENRCRFSEPTAGCVEPDDEARQDVRRPLSLPSFKPSRVYVRSGQVDELREHWFFDLLAP
jgi:hypothetical protein